MATNIAIIGAGVSGLTCGVVLAETGNRVTILAAECGDATTSAAAAAIWFPYDTEAGENAIELALSTYRELRGLTRDPDGGRFDDRVALLHASRRDRTAVVRCRIGSSPCGG